MLVQEEDHVGLARSIKEIAVRPNVLYEMGMSARLAVSARFEQEAQARSLESFYEEAIALRAAEEPVTEATAAAPQLAEQIPAK